MKLTSIILYLNLLLVTSLSGQKSYAESLQKCMKLDFIESQNCMLGKEIPAFEATTLNERVINNASLKNKVVVINFWFIACPPCIAELGGLNEV